ncbi:hypothetical protein imdm_1177 [gamma proteobacterium IMCC2047]|nr:hypothetical protein imdm_1177 [gamma proteobacterium IMCC2047]
MWGLFLVIQPIKWLSKSFLEKDRASILKDLVMDLNQS